MPYEKVGDNEPVCIADEVPFEIPESWEWCRLKDICNIINGFTPLKTEPTYWDNGDISWFTVEDIRDQGHRIKSTKQKITEKALSKNSNRILPKNTVLLCCTASVGEYAITEIETTTNQQFNGLVIKDEYKKYYSTEFLYLLVQSFKDRLVNAAGKTTFNFISVKKLGDFLIPLLSFQEQGRIIDKYYEFPNYIDKYDSLETELNKLNAEFPEKLKKSILQQAIQGKLVEQNSSDEPASVLLEKIRKEKEKLIKEGKIKKDKNESIIYKRDNSYYEKLNGVEKCIDDEIPFQIPESWEWCRLGNIGTMGRGTGIKRNETAEKGYPCVRYGELYTKYSYKFSQTHSFVPKNIFEKSYKISYGDLVYTLTGETKQDIAKTATFIGNGNVAVGGDLAFWKHHYMNSLYLEYFMFSPYCINSKINLSTGDIIVHISVDKISSILIPVPPLQEQQSIVGRIEQLFNILNTKII